MPDELATGRTDRAIGRFVRLSAGWRRLALALAAGALSALALAPLGWFPILFITMPVFVWLLDGCAAEPGAGAGAGLRSRLGLAFRVGWAFGFGYFLAGLWWIGAAFFADAGALLWLMPISIIALPAGLALFWGGAAAAALLVWSPGWPRLFTLAAALSLAEWLRGHVLTGFPWNALGYALMPSPLFMQIASLVGLWGVTLFAVLLFAAPALVVGPNSRGSRGEAVAFSVIVLLFMADIAFGFVRLNAAGTGTVEHVRLRLVQPNIAQDEKWSPAREGDVMSRYLGLSAAGMAEGAPAPFTVLIWPETAFPFYLTDRPEALAAIRALLPPGTVLLTGAARAELDPSDPSGIRAFNALYVIGDDGTILDAYDKVHLVPFGEYLPFEHLLRRIGLRQIVALPGGFEAGSRLRTLEAPGIPSFGALICYEIIFPGAVTDLSNRPRWLVNVTNDAWFGDTPGPRQHFQQAVVRAVEEGLPLARAANSGISAIVDPYGRIQSERGVGEVGVVDGPLPRPSSRTIYSLYGDTIYFGFLIFVITAAATGNFTRTKRRN